MRKFISGTGADTTAAVTSFRAANNQYAMADLVLIGELTDPLAVRLTSWPSPLLWSLWSSPTGTLPGPFLSAVIGRAKITSQEGLQVDTLDFTWSPLAMPFGTTIATANQYQKAQSGFWANKSFRLWRTLMPNAGDANTFGACIMFGGRIQDTTVERGKITFSINSFLDVVNQMIPASVIEWTNTLASNQGNTPVFQDGETQLPQFVVVAPSSNGVITAQCTSPTLNKIYSTNKFRFGFIKFNPSSSLAGYYATVSSNYNFRTAGGIHYNQFTVYQQFPWPPTVGDTFYASVQPPVNQADAVTAAQYDGFRWVPQPEGAL